ncbi:transposase, partial [bacterium]|nr:transposase [bacterium]
YTSWSCHLILHFVVMPFDPEAGWHSRGYLPHYDNSYVLQFVTYRLGDSIPVDVAERLRYGAELENDAAYRKRMDNYLDAGRAACWLKDGRAAQIVLDSWMHFDGERYRIHAWVIMPNHVHVPVQLIEPYLLSQAVKGWKSYTARRINALHGRSGRVWQVEFWERFIRDERHYKLVVQYIHDNPVKAGLVPRPHEWRWSSAKAWLTRVEEG